MPNITLKSKIINDSYTDFIYKSYDIKESDESVVVIPNEVGSIINEDWNIGIIYGNSGSGKSTILKSLGEINEVNFDNDKPLISNFDWLEPNDASLLLTSIGLSSVPTWLRPYRLLSNGEKYRAELAYRLGIGKEGETILIDEYTSVVDRDVAKAMSYALQKYVRRSNKKVVLASCHFDIMDWIMPDWSYSPQRGGGIDRADYLRQGKPKVELSVSRVEHKAFDLFKKHHYLTEDVNKSCMFFLFEWNNKPIGIVAINRSIGKGIVNGNNISRVVVLPDFQGLGFGVKICEFIAGILKNEEGNTYIKTVNPALGEYFNRSANWSPTAYNGRERKTHDPLVSGRVNRASYCHKYNGGAISGYEELLLPIEKMRDNRMFKHQLKLF